MWETILKTSIFAGTLNWICVGVVYVLENRISYILAPQAIIWTVLGVISYIKTRKT